MMGLKMTIGARVTLSALGLAGLLTGCATVMGGTYQEVFVNTNPPGATCELTRQGMYLGTIQSTPSSIRVEKTQEDIQIVCRKPGFQMAQAGNHSGVNVATVGNVIYGGLIGWAIDNWTDADSHYKSPILIAMVPEKQH